jgi:hypothetical protein
MLFRETIAAYLGNHKEACGQNAEFPLTLKPMIYKIEGKVVPVLN